MTNEQPNFYAILPAFIRYNKQLTSLEKLIYAEISALTNKDGYCNATNAYFAELFGKTSGWISKTINKLKNLGFVSITVEINDFKEVTNRKIYIGGGMVENYGGYGRKLLGGMVENYKGINSINDIKEINIKNIYKEKTQKTDFVPPNLQEVAEKFIENGLAAVDAEKQAKKFIDFYQKRFWTVQNVPMSSWRGAVATWVGNLKKRKNTQKPSVSPEDVLGIVSGVRNGFRSTTGLESAKNGVLNG